MCQIWIENFRKAFHSWVIMQNFWLGEYTQQLNKINHLINDVSELWSE